MNRSYALSDTAQVGLPSSVRPLDFDTIVSLLKRGMFILRAVHGVKPPNCHSQNCPDNPADNLQLFATHLLLIDLFLSISFDSMSNSIRFPLRILHLHLLLGSMIRVLPMISITSHKLRRGPLILISLGDSFRYRLINSPNSDLLPMIREQALLNPISYSYPLCLPKCSRLSNGRLTSPVPTSPRNPCANRIITYTA